MDARKKLHAFEILKKMPQPKWANVKYDNDYGKSNTIVSYQKRNSTA